MAFVAPAGTPISPLTFAVSLARGWTSSAEIPLGEGLATHAGHRRYWLVSTGRAAMDVARPANVQSLAAGICSHHEGQDRECGQAFLDA